MNELQRKIFSSPEVKEDAPAKPRLNERRREPRDRAARPVYVQSADPKAKRFEEVRTMHNFSRNGFYFITHEGSYRPGMPLQVIPAFGCFNFEYEGEVVRVERLPCGEQGVAVRLRRIVKLIVDANTSAKPTPEEVESPEPVLAGDFRG